VKAPSRSVLVTDERWRVLDQVCGEIIMLIGFLLPLRF